MARIGYQASHEQFSPAELLRYTQLAETAGFQFINSSDHFHPWNENQGHSGFSFAWLGAAMQSTSMPFSMICAPGQRYHPAIVAQAAATLTEMFPGRFTMALGSGEAINESITGEPWPSKPERNQRLLECATIIRRLFNGETVSHEGLVTVKNARLYTRPAMPPLLYCGALSPETAAWAGSWADGLLTAQQPMDKLKEVIQAFRNNGGEGKPVTLKVQISYADTDDDALIGAWEQWRTNIFSSLVLSDTVAVKDFEAMAESVLPEDMHEHVHISSDLSVHLKAIQSYLSLGIDDVIIHNVNKQQESFISDFGREVLPQL